jgi:hypothetical protein
MPDGQTFPQRPQWLAFVEKSTQIGLPVCDERQIRLGGQQKPLFTPGGGIANPGLFSGTWPGGQHSSGSRLKRPVGQQTRGELRVSPLSLGRSCSAHLVPGGQQTR